MKDKYNITIERKIETFLFGLIREYNISGLYIIVLLAKKYISLCISKSEEQARKMPSKTFYSTEM